MSDWKEYERLAARIYDELEPQARVTHNDKIQGLDSGTMRQIDVCIRTVMAAHELLVVVDAKDHKARIDVTKVGAFASLVTDVRASKGILVSNAGFTKNAMEYARKLGIDLCSLHDARSRNWSLDLRIPVLWTDLSPAIHVSLQLALQEGDSIPKDLKDWVFSIDGGKTDLMVLESFEVAWNSGKLDRTVGEVHTAKFPFDHITVLVDGGLWRPVVSLCLEYTVNRRAWFGYFKPSDARGILNRTNNRFIGRFSSSCFPTRRDKSWTSIDDPDVLAIAPMETLLTSEGWQIVTGASTSEVSFRKID